MNNDAKRVVDVVIKKESSGVTSANFATPLFLSKTTHATTRSVKSYNSPSEVMTDYTSTSPEYYASIAHFSVVGAPKIFKIAIYKTGDLIPDALTALQALDNDWYGIIPEDLLTATQDAVASWCQLNGKFMFGGAITAVLTAVETTSTPYVLNLANRVKSHIIYNSKLRDVPSKEAGYADVSFASMVLGKTIGSYTAVYKDLPSMQADKVTSTDVTTLKTKNTSYYTNMYGLNKTFGGRTCGGTLSDWLDVEIGIDWLQTIIQENVLNLFFSKDKVAYTEEGVGLIRLTVDTQLQRAVKSGLLASYVLTSEPVSEQTTTDKNNRVYNGISFTAVLAGAIHSTTINGKVSV